MAIKRDKLDNIFSLLVRERADNRCEHTGQSGDTVQLECAHIWGRRNRSVRWHPMNAVSLCHFSHRYFTENPAAFMGWLASKWHPAQLELLEREARTPQKFTPRQLEGLYQFMLTEYARLRRAREAGREGRIEFSFPHPIPEAEPRKKAKKAKAKSKFKRKVNGTTVRRDAA